MVSRDTEPMVELLARADVRAVFEPEEPCAVESEGDCAVGWVGVCRVGDEPFRYDCVPESE